MSTITLRIDPTAWFVQHKAEEVLPLLLRGADAGTVEIPFGGEDREVLACLHGFLKEEVVQGGSFGRKGLLATIVNRAADAHLVGIKHGGVIRVEAHALSEGQVGLLSRFEASGPRGKLRLEVQPGLSALALDWDREAGEIEKVYLAARTRDERSAAQARDESREELRNRFAARLLGELPHAVWTQTLLSGSRLEELGQRWQDPAALRSSVEEKLLQMSQPHAVDGNYGVTLLPTESEWMLPGVLMAYTALAAVDAEPEVEQWIRSGRALVPAAFRTPLLRDTSPPAFPGSSGIAVAAPLDAVFNDPNLLETDDAINDITARCREALIRHGTEALGWYQTCHVYDDGFWGVYLHLPHIRDLARVMLERMIQEKCWKGLSDLFQVVSLLVCEHELFHARVDFLALGHELATRRPLALPYHHQVYRPAIAGSGSLEEALANFVGYQAATALLAGWKAHGRWDDRSVQVATEFLKEQFDASPAGYRDWRMGEDVQSWRRLVYQVLNGEEQPPGELPPLEAWLRQPAAPLVEQGAVPLAWWLVAAADADRLFGTPSRREVERFLRHHGWQPDPTRGNGSHVLWQSPEGKGFPLPHKRELSRGVFRSFLHLFRLTKADYVAIRKTF